MKMRHHKLNVCARMMPGAAKETAWRRALARSRGYVPHPSISPPRFHILDESGSVAGPDILATLQNLKPTIPTTYKVTRVKDDVVMLETDSKEEAQGMIDKAARQKKAKLQLVEV